MPLGFWSKLEKPFFVLAPLANVTDAAFRRVIAKYGKPAVLWTEFVSADGLAHTPKLPQGAVGRTGKLVLGGREHLLPDLAYTEGERPIVAQLFTGNSDKMRIAAALVEELGFDGLDINMGCPDRTIEKQGAGAALIKTPEQAKQVIRAAKEGAPNLPISVKTRVGYNKDEIDAWIPALLAEDIAALTIHARTRKEMSDVPARWDDVARVVKIRDAMKKKTFVIGNGDVKNLDDARKKIKESGADGAMLGRAIFGNPWLFAEKVPSVTEKLEALIEHTKLFEELLGKIKSFSIMKKHYKAYVNGFPRALELRMKLMEAKNASEVERIVLRFLS